MFQRKGSRGLLISVLGIAAFMGAAWGFQPALSPWLRVTLFVAASCSIMLLIGILLVRE